MLFLDEAKIKGLAAPSNLSMNQTLEGHSGKSSWVFHVFFFFNYNKNTGFEKMYKVFFLKALIKSLK